MSLINGRKLTIPASIILVSFLAYSSQYLFYYLEPGPLTFKESLYFNVTVLFVFICYFRSIVTNPGIIPASISTSTSNINEDDSQEDQEHKILSKQRICRICNINKPQRSHHCRICKRCIPKMDHHCPWTYNCVSYRTWPHFMRFILYAVTSVWMSEYFLYIRTSHLWKNKHIPIHTGITINQLTHLFILNLVNIITLIAMTILFFKSIWSMVFNVTTIEEWEIDRHETLLRRAKLNGGYLDGPDGIVIRMKRQEFPFDIGIWRNIKQSMHSSNPFTMFSPFSKSPPMDSGLIFETNGMEDKTIGWPPPDPDRIPRKLRKYGVSEDADDQVIDTNILNIDAFRKRQQQDIQVKRRKPFYSRYKEEDILRNDTSKPELYVDQEKDVGEESWKSTEGQQLKDFGLDEEIEFYDQNHQDDHRNDDAYDDDELPLSELLKNRKYSSARVKQG